MEGYVKEIKNLETELFKNALGIQLQGCTLNCPFCPKYDDRVFDEIFLKDIFEIKSMLNEFDFSSVVIYGGEPLVQDSFLSDLLKLFKNDNVWLITNATKPNALDTLLNQFDNINFVIRWWSFSNSLFNRLTNVKSFFQSEKIVLYDILLSLYKLKQSNTNVWFSLMLIPGVFFTKEQIMRELEFIHSFGFYPNIILTPLNVSEARGRWKNLNSFSLPYLETLKNVLEKEGFKVVIDLHFP